MGATKGHSFKFTQKALRNIDYLLPKLKFSVMPSKIVRWLENFEEDDLKYAYDFLQVFEYINFNEMQYRLEDLLKKIFMDLHNTDNALVIPYGKFGKSGTLVTYPLSHSPFYLELEKKGRIIIKKDLKKLDVESYNCIILIDDFIGSGKTFCDEYRDEGIEKWIKNRSKLPKVYVLSTVIMAQGRKKIEDTFKYIKVYAQERAKIFDKSSSPLIALGNFEKHKINSRKYEQRIKVSQDYLGGYKDSQGLLAFSHGTPNNTLPLFWWGKNWIPLFPRRAKTRMDEAREFKKSIAFYIGICNRLGIDLLSLEEYKQASNTVKVEDQRKYNNKLHHSIIALLKLKLEGTEDYIICHILGLTDNELDEVYERSRKIGFVDLSRRLTSKATVYFNNLERRISKERSRNETEQNLKPKELIYIPKTFEGLT
ncbi:hypothetical protein RM553_08325 [Zunongwangia sp. F363]|uniref:Uncharacterized protein n=1 Tax=Autumnicola tepida TaxID=3075595 RepID=A0ABU3C919_9FLAO|nr:hypothetical protein [Zunongwangia sp. F363]MDT0642834.1 hypothetical protein [Zunongwangia sp. F363]